MAEIIGNDLNKDIDLAEGETLATLEELQQMPADEPAPKATEEPTPEEPAADEDVPVKYRGKSKAEIAVMHREVESAFGRQGNEIAELRKKLAALESQSAREPVAKQPEPTDFYVDPAKATSESIESHPVVKGLLEKTEAQERREAERAIKKAHPDIGEILQDEAFFKWIEESPVRTRLLKETDKSFDPEIMGELVTNFKDLRAAAKAREVSADAERNQAAKDASVGNARGAVNQGRKGKKYRASDLRKLQRSDPKTYYARSAEFDLAFQQGRVIMDA